MSYLRRALLLAVFMPLMHVTAAADPIRFQRGDVDALDLLRDPDRRIMLVQFRETPSREDRSRLEAAGVDLMDYVPRHAYWARLAEGASSIESFDGVIGWGSPSPELKLSIGLSAADLASADRIPVQVTMFSGVTEDELRRAVRRIDPGAVLTRSHGTVFRSVLRGRDLRTIADLEIVQWIAPPIESFTLDNAASAVMADITPLHESPLSLTGTGIDVAVFDACYPELDHADFGGRIAIARIAQWCIDQGLFDQSHPTHVAGTVASSGANDPAAKGMAPESFVHAYTFALYHYDDLVTDFTSLDVRLSNHSYSWGSYPYGAYEQDAHTVDDIAQQTDVAMFWSSGNDGFPQEWGGFTPGGWTSQRNGGLAKNTFSVCALGTNYFGNYMVKLDSSRGPTLDGRVKPDFCALGTNVYSLEPDGSCATPPCYGTKSGTSQASPALAGGSALLYELHTNMYGATLRLDLLRAVLIHSAIDLHESNSGRWFNELLASDATVGPDYVTGWGVPDFDAAADLLINQAWSTGTVADGQVDEHDIGVVGDQPLRATLAWVDDPGTPGAAVALVNDLDLELVAPDGTIHYPWILGKDSPGTPATRGVNGVDISEQVIVDAPVQGTWKTRVIGSDLAGGAAMLDYALVVTGTTSSDLQTPGHVETLSVEKTETPGEMIVHWAPPACMAADNAIVFGPLAAVTTYGYSGQVCSIGSSGSHGPFDPGAGSFFFVVVANDGSTHEGSYGTDSTGVERPEDVGCPMPQLLSLRCD